jgi:hypothetical protein
MYLWELLFLQGDLCCFVDKCPVFAVQDRRDREEIDVVLMFLFAMAMCIAC